METQLMTNKSDLNVRFDSAGLFSQLLKQLLLLCVHTVGLQLTVVHRALFAAKVQRKRLKSFQMVWGTIDLTTLEDYKKVLVL